MTLSFTKRPVGVLVRIDYGGKGGSGMSVGRGDSVLGETGCQNEWLSRCGQQWIKPDAGRADFSSSSHFSSYGVINFRCKGETRHPENTKGRRKTFHIRQE